MRKVLGEVGVMRILVTGGAGYIGSHAVRHLLEHGHQVTVLDNLVAGHAAAVPPGLLVRGSLDDRALVSAVLRENRIEAIMHFAAFALVGESVTDPAKYYYNNVVATAALFETARSAGVSRFVFSSTCATYGVPDRMPINEQTPQRPINPYGRSKLMVEQMLRDYAAAYGWGYAALRYFNASGAAADGSLGEDHDPETHLLPIVLQTALGQRPAVNVFGTDYPTPDGTCIRDYIHVEDLAAAHRLALERLEPGKGLELNLGTGRGYSVKEVIETCRSVTGREIPCEWHPRRPGDPPSLVADSALARRVLDWEPRYQELEAIVRTAWNWHSRHPHGYPRGSA